MSELDDISNTLVENIDGVLLFSPNKEFYEKLI